MNLLKNHLVQILSQIEMNGIKLIVIILKNYQKILQIKLKKSKNKFFDSKKRI